MANGYATSTEDRISVSDVLLGMRLGIVTHEVGAGFVIRQRRCTDCGVQLPEVALDGRLDTFPRCSAHAF